MKKLLLILAIIIFIFLGYFLWGTLNFKPDDRFTPVPNVEVPKVEYPDWDGKG